MKRYLKPILAVVIISLSFTIFSACGEKEANNTPAPPTETTDLDNTEEPKKEDSEENNKSEFLKFELGNDIGKTVVKLSFKAQEGDDWTEIKLFEDVWQSGFIIPVEVELKNKKNPESGWYIRTVFEDGTEELFEGVKLTEGSSVILTEEGPVY